MPTQTPSVVAAPRPVPEAPIGSGVSSAPGPLGRTYRIRADVDGTARFAHCWDGARTALLEAMLATLASTHPGIAVESDVGEGAVMRERLVTALASGSPPDVVMVKSDATPYFADQDALLPLDDLMARDGIARDWFGASDLASSTWGGRVFGLPQVAAGAQHLLFVNTGLLARIGVDPTGPIETWQDLEALIEPARNAGLLVLDPTRSARGVTGHQLLTYANGGGYWDRMQERVTWADGPGVQAAAWMLRFVQAQTGSYERLVGGGATGSSARLPLQPAEWAREKALCCVNGDGWLYQLSQEAPQLQYAVYPFPRNADNRASTGATPSTGAWMLSIPRAARNHEAAWEIVKYATVSPEACGFTTRQRRPSPLAGCDEASGLARSEPTWPAISTSIARSVTVPVSPIQPRLEQIASEMQDDLLLERRSPRAALESAALDAQRLLDAWHASGPHASSAQRPG